MVYLAFDKKSNFPTRIAALGAIALMMITIIICVVLIFTDHSAPIDDSVLIVGAVVEEIETDSGNFWIMLLLIFALIGIFTVIALHSMKEHKKHVKKAADSSLKISKSFDF